MDTDFEYLKKVLEAIGKVQKDSGDVTSSTSTVNASSAKKSATSTKTAGITTNHDLIEYSKSYIDFTYRSPTIFHVASYFKNELTKAGFKYLPESSDWSSITPGKYFTIRNGSAVGAFVVGKDWTPERGVGVIGAHADALAAKLKPASTKPNVDGYELLGVAPYAGTLNWLWFDRDLGVGGKVLVKKDGVITAKLIDSTPHPIAHIPTLAPHFGAVSQELNKETNAVPVVGFTSGEEEEAATEEEKNAPLYGKHALKLLRYIAKLAKVNVSDIVQWDLDLYDIQKGTVGGLNDEFIYSPRIDDRINSYAAIHSLLEADRDGLLPSDTFALVGLFDNEEVGSLTRQGIKGGLIESIVGRTISALDKDGSDIQEKLRVAYANTIILSADVSHLLNPNYQHVYLEGHKPVPNTGIAVALDPNGHMATDAVGTALIEDLARQNGDVLQYFQIRNDSRSGGTIGPSIASQTGARTIDLGIAQLSMHSIRAATGSKDVGLGLKFFKGFFANWRSTYDNYRDL